MEDLFIGFEPVLPGWLLTFTLFGSTGIAWWTYSRIDDLSTFYRYLLIIFRSAALFILVVLLLNPFFKSDSVVYEKPEIMYLLDNSSSVSIKKGAYNGLETYRNVLQDLNLEDTSNVKKNIYAFDTRVLKKHPDSLTFRGSETHLYRALEAINERGRDVRAAVLITDGIFTTGRDPSYLASQQKIPVFMIGLGDTTTVKDIVVKNVITNNTGYTNTLHPVEVTILNQGYPDTPLEVSIMSDGKTIERKEITTNAVTSSHNVSFELDLEKEGLKQFEVRVAPLDNEWITRNNQDTFSIDIQDNKTRILHISFEVHPDVKTIRHILGTDKSYAIKTLDYVGSGNFYGGDLPANTDSLDLIILQGYQDNILPRSVKKTINDLLRSSSVLFVNTPLTNYGSNSQEISEMLPVLQDAISDTYPVTPVQAVEDQQHPILELPEINYSILSPVYAPIQNLRAKARANTLYTASYHSNKTNAPLIAVMETGNVRTAALLFYNFYRWQQSENQQIRDFIETLLFNLTDWTSTQPDNQRLKVVPEQKVTEEGEAITLNAFLKNESNEQENDAIIDVVVSSDKIDQRFYTMQNVGNGRYSLTIDNLPRGLYNFEAKAGKGGRTIDTKSGEFSITQTNEEFVNTTRNDQLLNQIALSTDARYLTFNNADSLNHILRERGLLSKTETTVTRTHYPYQKSWWFVAVMVFLVGEWILRKYLALP